MRAAFALVGVLVAGASSADEPPALADLLAQTGKYVRGLQQDFATVISDETYTQRERFSEQRSGKEKTSTAERTMRSEMLFLWLPQEREWLAVRNVLSVDRKAVPDSQTRLDQMLANPEPDAIARFRNLRDEGARFNIGRLTRNTSDRTLAFYGREGKLGGWVPVRMDEEYTQHVDEASAAPLLAQATGGPTLTPRRFALDHPFHEAISCSASYTNYRRFETAARILAPK
jgi:hypothetical protein